ncbi:MAG TPA: zinc-ribbon domain-containing protein, partial [Myxococcota bacterium]|nr:zinc-ribbon domain-containing protein [Myxococcota bacterium]
QEGPMIAACPTCGARYRIDVAKLPADGARLRCARCEAVFRVRPPADASGARPAAAPAAVQSARVEAPPPPPREPAPAPDAPVRDTSRLVLVANPEVAGGKSVCAALGRWGFESLLVHDGVEAILTVQRSLPRVVVLDAALPKMFGFQVCELIKRNESLRSISVVLVGAIHDPSRYRRPPGELYGADAYVERPELPEALGPILAGLGLAIQGAEPRPEPTPRRLLPLSEPAAPAAASPPSPAPRAPARPAPARAPAPAAAPRMPSGDGLDEARAQAERLARIIVSDIVLYNAEKFEAGVRAGDVISALDVELEEGRALFGSRIDPRVGTADEFLQRELLRVARQRGMAG